MSREDEEFQYDNDGMPDFLRDPLGVFSRHWLACVVGLAAGLALIAGGYYRYVPKYSATTSIQVTSQGIPEDLVRSTVQEDPFARLNAMIGRVLTRNKLALLIEEFDLYPGLREALTLAEVVEIMRADIDIEPRAMVGGVRRGAELSRMFDLTYYSTDREVVADVANRLSSLFVEAGLETRMERATGISSFLQRQLEDAQRELQEQEREIAKFKEEYRGELPSEFEANTRRLERLQDQRQTLAIQIAEAESRIAMVAASEAEDATSPAGRLAALEAELERELAVHTEQHPSVKALIRQITAAELEVTYQKQASDTSRGALVEASRQTVDQLRKELDSTKRAIADLDARVARTPKRQEVLAAQEDRAAVLREEMLGLMHKVGEAELAENLEAAQQGASIKVMDRAQAPTAPIHSRPKLLAAGCVGALGLAGLFGFFFEFRDPVLVSEDQVERLSGSTVLGSIPRLN